MSEPATQMDPHADQKRQAAEYAVRYVQSGMAVGLGTGSTAVFAVRLIGQLLRTGALKDIVAFATSKGTAQEAIQGRRRRAPARKAGGAKHRPRDHRGR